MDTRDGRIYSQSELDMILRDVPEDKKYFKPMKMAPTGEQLRRGRVGRNEPCPCGSGIKFKRCCLVQMTRQERKQHRRRIWVKTPDGQHVGTIPADQLELAKAKGYVPLNYSNRFIDTPGDVRLAGGHGDDTDPSESDQQPAGTAERAGTPQAPERVLGDAGGRDGAGVPETAVCDQRADAGR